VWIVKFNGMGCSVVVCCVVCVDWICLVVNNSLASGGNSVVEEELQGHDN